MAEKTYRVRDGRALELPTGVAWARGGECVRIDMRSRWAQQWIAPQADRLREIDAAERVVELPEQARGEYERTLPAEPAQPEKRKPGRPRKNFAAPENRMVPSAPENR